MWSPTGSPISPEGRDLRQPPQRRVAEIVLEDAQRGSGEFGRRQHPLGAFHVAGQWLLDLDVAPGVEHRGGDLGMAWRRHQHVDHVGSDGEELSEVRGHERTGEGPGPSTEAPRVAVADPHQLDVGTTEVGRDHQLTDLSRTDDREADRAVDRERNGHRTEV